jgi:hypothetical protein
VCPTVPTADVATGEATVRGSVDEIQDIFEGWMCGEDGFVQKCVKSGTALVGQHHQPWNIAKRVPAALQEV